MTGVVNSDGKFTPVSLIPVAFFCCWYWWQFATGVVDTSTFAAGIVDTGGNKTISTGGKIYRRCPWYWWQICHQCCCDTDGVPWLTNISANFEKIWNDPNFLFKGLGGRWFMKGTRSKKSRDTGMAQVSKSLYCVSVASPTCRTPPGWQGERESWWRHGSGHKKACLAFLWLLLPAEPHQDGKNRKNHDGGMAQVSKSLYCMPVASPTCRNPPGRQGEKESWWRHGTGLKKLALRFCGFSYLQNPTKMARRERIMMAAWLRSARKTASWVTSTPRWSGQLEDDMEETWKRFRILRMHYFFFLTSQTCKALKELFFHK
jgi:hypothetical protein